MSSFIGGTVAILVLASLAPALGEVALLFGPADYCALMMLGFVCVSFVTTGSLLNGLAMCMVGILLFNNVLLVVAAACGVGAAATVVGAAAMVAGATWVGAAALVAGAGATVAAAGGGAAGLAGLHAVSTLIVPKPAANVRN